MLVEKPPDECLKRRGNSDTERLRRGNGRGRKKRSGGVGGRRRRSGCLELGEKGGWGSEKMDGETEREGWRAGGETELQAGETAAAVQTRNVR